MSEIPADLKYSEDHEWVRMEDDGTVTVGITEHAQELLGEMVYVELPDIGATLAAGDEAGVAESVKAASDVYTPVSGEVVAVNEALEDAPDMLNNDPYNDGWLFRVKLADAAELDQLLGADGYAEHVANDEH